MAGDTHYFLLSSLPTLQSDQRPAISYADFVERCENAQAGSVVSILDGLDLFKPAKTRNRLLDHWAQYKTQALEFLAALRSRRAQKSQGNEAALALAPGDAQRLRSAFEESDALKAEMSLAAYEVSLVSEAALGHYFDDDALIAYGLKVKILERITAMEEQAGRQAFDAAYQTIQEHMGAPGASEQDGVAI